MWKTLKRLGMTLGGAFIAAGLSLSLLGLFGGAASDVWVHRSGLDLLLPAFILFLGLQQSWVLAKSLVRNRTPQARQPSGMRAALWTLLLAPMVTLVVVGALGLVDLGWRRFDTFTEEQGLLSLAISLPLLIVWGIVCWRAFGQAQANEERDRQKAEIVALMENLKTSLAAKNAAERAAATANPPDAPPDSNPT